MFDTVHVIVIPGGWVFSAGLELTGILGF